MSFLIAILALVIALLAGTLIAPRGATPFGRSGAWIGHYDGG